MENDVLFHTSLHNSLFTDILLVVLNQPRKLANNNNQCSIYCFVDCLDLRKQMVKTLTMWTKLNVHYFCGCYIMNNTKY